ncbi:MAG: glutamate mutase L [bacterium]|nr:glutamate mutase L [bacterium]
MYENLNVIIATDCGSTTTKAILIEKKNGEYRQTYRGEAPTTVESPFNDVTRGVLNAIAEVEELSGRKILDGEKIIHPAQGNSGVDIYISTSSAGGGLQMLVAGAVKTMTAESAQRAALGAGAIVMDVLASNDGRLPHQKIERIRGFRPDMILLSGGTDGGTVAHVVELAEYIAAANPKPRLGHTFRLPIIYAGNKDARLEVDKVLGKIVDLVITDNIRPRLEVENLFPARQKIQDLFMEHVMAQAPGYGKLKEWVEVPIMPTPAAVGNLIETVAEQEKINVIGVDIGGATTDVFSVFDTVFNRTVSANLGLSYSVSNVLAEAGLDNVMRWLPFDIDPNDLRNRIKNKMIRPTTIPQTLPELMVEQAISREALRLAFDQHKSLAVGLKGVQQERSIADSFKQTESGLTLINMQDLNLLIGSGGVLSHAPRRVQSMLMMIDAFQPEGFTRLAVDSIFMMPHLGALASVNETAATEVFEKDCLINLGTCIAIRGEGKPGQICVEYKLNIDGGETIEQSLPAGEIIMHPLPLAQTATIEVRPARGFDAGAGSGKAVTQKITGGVVGVVVDTRGRPLSLSTDHKERQEQLTKWNKTLNLYPR